jgi:hypothetical protein
MRLTTKTKWLVPLAVVGIFLITTAGACGSDGNGQASETKTQQSGYDKLVAEQPAHTMPYSPSRDTINGWIDTWGVKGQLAFTYILNANGEKIGYYVFQGPPVTYCAALTPNYKIHYDSNGNFTTPAPGIDGVFYSGGQCSDYIGKDATTGNIIDFTVGNGQNFITATQPLYLNVPPLGYTKIADVHKNSDGEYVK